MSLDVYLTKPGTVEVFDANITHNLGRMAAQAGIYECLWRAEETGIQKAAQVAEPLRKGIDLMRSDPDLFRNYDAKNGWGTYDQFLPWLESYLAACLENLGANVSTSK